MSRSLRQCHPADLAALACTLALLAAGVAFGVANDVPGYGVETDFVGAYAPEARNLLAGRPYTYPFHPPGYPALIAAASFLTGGDLFVAAKLVSAAAAAMLAATTYLLFRHLFGRTAALATTLVLAATLLPFSYLAATDIVAAALIQLPIVVLLARGRTSPRRIVVVGLLAGFAYLVRSHGLVVLAAAGLWLLLRTRPTAHGRRIAQLATLVAAFVVAVAPAYLYNLLTTGHLLFPSAYAQIGVSFSDGTVATAPQASAVTGAESVLEVVSRSPLGFVRRYVENTFYWHPRLLLIQALGVPAAIFAGAGALLLAGGLTRRRTAYLLMCLLGYLPLGLMDYERRYHVFVFPVLALLAALVLTNRPLTDRLARGPVRGATIRWALVAAVTFLTAWDTVDRVQADLAQAPRYLLPAARHLRTRASPGDRVLSEKPHLASFAGLARVQMNGRTPEAIVREAGDSGARFILYTPLEATRWPPLAGLASPADAPRGIRAIYRDTASGTVIYETVPRR